jgi:signal transduction histidine kinase
MLEAWVPLERADTHAFNGAAQFWIDGRNVAAELSSLDRRLARQAGLAWLAGAVVIALALAWAFRRLAAANDVLRARSEDLVRANRELVLAAKTSALGAVTAHLIHEIKNPVAGLEIFVANQADAAAREDPGAELAAASELTRRLRTMINDVVAVLRDEQLDTQFELTADEICELAVAHIRPTITARGLTLVCEPAALASLKGRQANLAGLILRNLLQNALEATPPGGRVRLASVGAKKPEPVLEFLVEDSGPGVPDAVRARLFQPCQSSKPGGSGLGLALSAQLAQQAGGRLELVRSDSSGTSFRLVMSLAG